MSEIMNENKINGTAEMTAGQMLRNARTTGRRRRELATVARILCIREEFLDALENDDFNRIPELVYILGFARNYAMELELDPFVVVEKIKKQMGLTEEEDAVEVEGEALPEQVAAINPKRTYYGPTFLQKNAKTLFVTFVLVIVISVSGLIIMQGRNQPPAPPSPVAPAVPEMANRSLNLPIAHEYGLRNRDFSNITLQARGQTWIQIRNNAGTVIFEHTMSAGDVYYALNGTVATIGNAGALDIWVNGREIPRLGTEGQRVADVVLSPETLVK